MRAFFGASREEIWRQLSAEVGAMYVQGGFWKRDQVRASHGDWTMTLDTQFSAGNKADYTRLRAPFVNVDGFRFTIYRRGMFSDIAKAFGMQDVEVGHADFDRNFIIQGTDESKLRALFDNSRLRALIAAQPAIQFTMQPVEASSEAGGPAATDCASASG